AIAAGDAGLQGELVNAGRGGDTVASLRDRLGGLLQRWQPDWLIVAVGSNDVWLPWLSSHSLGWRLGLGLRRLQTGQTPTSDLDQFAAVYRDIIDLARKAGAQVMACTVSPIGERLSSPVNRQVARLNGIIKHVAADRQVPVADIWQAFVEVLAAQPKRSAYLPGEWLFASMDRRAYRPDTVDQVARRRRLHLTFDGIHLNTRGARLWAGTVLKALVQAQQPGEAVPGLARQLALPCLQQGPLKVCYSAGWEARAHDIAGLLGGCYEHMAAQTGARPPVEVALLSRVHWPQGPCTAPYPRPCAGWNGESGTLCVPDAYDEAFLREWHLPETVAAWTSWPADMGGLGARARATALADLLAIQELARIFLHDLRVAPSDPALAHLLAAYLTQVVLRGSRGRGTARMAALWNAWGQVLDRAGIDEGRVRLLGRELYAEHGDRLVASFAGTPASVVEQVTATLSPGASRRA
ncbi:MAG: GDSL-type esterase/lipase family protein, partial [Anaerolineae bacterium]|nr:GDSL-type esterase/lipase family protein [Anaerolineae bacterium]